jgi:hypothetical protein
MSHSVELVGNGRKDTLWSGFSERCQRKGASDKGEFEDGSDEAKELP